MTKKFTEEQYVLAIANTLTREWAHDKFVEKEKKYYWVSNKSDNEGNFPALYKNELGIVIFEVREVGVISRLTISEIEEWGYNPDMFDREEVE
ncbi:hypothetical protein LMG30234_GAICNKDF_00577 [Fructobacillus fructosus]|uniref:hypothetical protein n=1 Tax=Fructobacillus fructosus TaxID=1631 RepID=UPI002DA61926|nr:hypothetical protein LMG30234_GAICNKDF_00577 [Fructobacillus fructosus]